jgi:arginine/ornithine transport system permease protein
MFDLHGYGPIILQGFWVTIKVSLLSLLISLFLGNIGAIFKLSKFRILKSLAQVYTTVIRGVPDLVMMLIIYFGGQVLVNNLASYFGYDGYIDINPFIAGVLTIGFIFGAYMTETIRGGILAVSKGQLEAAYSFGMTRIQVFFRVLLPQMIRHALPGFGNIWLIMIKSTALVSVIGLDDVVRKSALAAGATREPFTFYMLAALLYLVITALSNFGLKRLEFKYNFKFRRVS